MLDILSKLDAKGIRSEPISPFVGSTVGITTSLSDGIMPRNGRNNNIAYFEGNFQTGPLFSDLPFDPGVLHQEAGYRAVLKREVLPGTTPTNVWQHQGDAAYMLRDELTMMIVPRWHTEAIREGEYNFLNQLAGNSPSVFRWERTLTFRSGDAAVGQNYVSALWDLWTPIHPSDRAMPARLIPYGGSSYYYIDPNLSKQWYINSFNPAYGILVNNLRQGPYASYGVLVVAARNGTAGVTGTPFLAHRTPRDSAWQGVPHVFNSARMSRFIIDSTGYTAPVFMTGVSNG